MGISWQNCPVDNCDRVFASRVALEKHYAVEHCVVLDHYMINIRGSPAGNALTVSTVNILIAVVEHLNTRQAYSRFIRIQWGSEIQPFEIRKHSKSRFFEDQILNGPYVVGVQMVPTIRKPEKMVDLF